MPVELTTMQNARDRSLCAAAFNELALRDGLPEILRMQFPVSGSPPTDVLLLGEVLLHERSPGSADMLLRAEDGMLIALVMHRAIFGRGPVRAAILVPYGIVTVVAAFAWRYAFDPTSGFVPGLPVVPDDFAPLTDKPGSLLVIILAEVWKTTPFMALLLLAGLALVPDELHEAAKVDGASTVQRFFRITLPLMRPAILVALLFRTLDAFRIFDNIFIIQPGGAIGTESVSILGYNVLINRVNLGLGSAVSILIFLCVILIAIFFVKVLGTSTAQQRGEA